MSTAVLVLAAGLLAAGVMVLAGGFLGPMAIWAAAPLALLLVIAVGGYRRRPLWAVIALAVGGFVFVLGLQMETQRVLDERGEWVRATIVSNEKPYGVNGYNCELEFLNSRPNEEVACWKDDKVGSKVDVLVDPEGEVPSGLGGIPSASTTATMSAVLGAVFTGSVMAGTFTGHRYRRSIPAPDAPTMPLPPQPY